jgi:hypothetical protein
MRRLCLASTVLVLALACNDVTTPPQPAAFDRPESLVFFCWSFDADGDTPGVRGGPVALSECAPRALEGDEDDRAEPRAGFALHALVTQTSTGEVAAVRLSGQENEPGVIDSDVRVPGFTFAAVGEVPSGLAISRLDPKHLFVVSRGTSDIQVIDVADFRKGTGVDVQRFAGLLPDGARPSDMVLSPDEDALIVALPLTGQLARIPVLGGGELGEPELVTLSDVEPDPVDLNDVPADQRPADYRVTCPRELDVFEPPITAPREPVRRGDTPEPWDLLLDPETGRLLVADRSLPLIHVVDPADLSEDEPLNVSVPTRALALTPRVPSEAFPPGGPLPPATERFLYAIDELERSVLVVDAAPESPTFGAVLPASVTAPTDRLAVPERARALAVATPDYSPDEGVTRDCTAPLDPEDEAAGTNLHGVFLTVGTTDGRIRFFDVYDLDTACRGDAAQCGAVASSPGDQFVAIGRHRPRIGASLELDETVQVTPDPSWDTIGAGSVTVAGDGATTEPGLVPPLEPVPDGCEAPLDAVFPPTGPARICAVTDPWAATPERFTVGFEGTIPFTGTTGANFDGDALLLRSNPCDRGVIGSAQVPEEGYLSDYAGDAVAITADLPPSILNTDDDELLARCEELTQRTTAGETTPVRIEITRALSRPEEPYAGRLELGEVLEPADGGFTLDDVRACFPELLEVEVRARDAFLVRSSRAGFSTPIVDGAGGECTVDPERVARGEIGRAFFGETYRSPFVAFRLGGRPDNIGRPTLEITIGDVPPSLTIDVSSLGGADAPSLLTTLVYNEVDERLYAVDQAVQGLLRIRLNNPAITVQQTFQ